MPTLYHPLSDWMKARFGCKVFKVTIDAGFTCPNRDGTKGVGGCVYCNSDTLIPKDFSDSDIERQLASGIDKVRKRHKADKFIAYFQINTNTHAPVEQLTALYKKALHPDVVGLAVSTRPDCVDKEVVGLFSELKKERHLWVELGLQSANDATLKAINRGHTADEFRSAALMLKEADIDICAHIIIGLPNEKKEDILNTVNFLSGFNIWGVKFHQLQVLKGTKLEEEYNKGLVKTLSLDEYAGLVVESLEALPPETVIHRLSGDAPKRYVVAPGWGVNKFIIAQAVVDLMRERKTFQGAKRPRSSYGAHP